MAGGESVRLCVFVSCLLLKPRCAMLSINSTNRDCGGKMIIRRMTIEDLEPLYGLLSDSQVMQYIESPYTMEKTERFLLNAGLSAHPLVYAVDEDGTFIGYVIYHDYDESSVEIGWVLYPEYWGKGCASRLTKQLIERATSSGKDVVIECVPQQEASKHIAMKYGFEYQGSMDNLDVYKRAR